MTDPRPCFPERLARYGLKRARPTCKHGKSGPKSESKAHFSKKTGKVLKGSCRAIMSCLILCLDPARLFLSGRPRSVLSELGQAKKCASDQTFGLAGRCGFERNIIEAVQYFIN